MTLTILQASKKSKLSQKTIRRHIHAKTLNFTKVNNSYRIKQEDFNKWIENLNFNNKKIKASKIFLNKNEIIEDESSFVSVSKEFSKDYWLKPNKKGIKFADFFSGAGGLTVGLVKAGLKPVYSVEIMPQAVRTYFSNISSKFNERKTEIQDITNKEVKKDAIKKLKKEKVHLIVGGFPCQGFSMAGNRIVDDSRNSLYMHLLEIIKEVKPKIVLMENVQGLRSMLNGAIENKIISDFQKAGYKISIKTLNSADYKTPQQRKRAIIIANRISKINLFPTPILKSEKYITVKDAIQDLVLSKEDIDFNHEFTKHSEKMIKKISKLNEGESLYKEYSDAWKKVFWNKPSPTVKENHGGVFIHPKFNRVMTPRELARLQSFPDDFIFKGSKKWQLVQIGNAVPPLMAKAVGLSIKKMFS